MVALSSAESEPWAITLRQEITDHCQFLPGLDLCIAVVELSKIDGTSHQALIKAHTLGASRLQQVANSGC